jgi:hypothetical protein
MLHKPIMSGHTDASILRRPRLDATKWKNAVDIKGLGTGRSLQRQHEKSTSSMPERGTPGLASPG